MHRLLLLLSVVASAIGQQYYVFKPMRIYAQDKAVAKEALAELAMHFNVSLYPNFNQSCEKLIAICQEYSDVTSIVLISNQAGNCPKDLWPGAFLTVIKEEAALQGRKVIDWKSFTTNLIGRNNLAAEIFVHKSEIQTLASIKETPTEAKSNKSGSAGLLVPWYGIALLIIFVVILLVGCVVMLVFILRRKPIPKEGQNKSKDSRSLSIPDPKSRGSSISSKSEKGEKSQRSCQRSPSKKKKKIEKCSTKEEEKNDKPSNPLRSAEAIISTDNDPLRSDNMSEKKGDIEQPPERSLEKRIELPVTKEEFSYHVQSLLLREIIDYCEENMAYQVYPSEQPGFLFKRLNQELPQKPAGHQTIKEMKELLTQTILPGMTHAQHLRYHAFFSCGRSYPDIMAEMLIAALGVVGNTWDSCPSLVEMEYSMINWLAKSLAIPKVFHFTEKVEESPGGGCFLETSTEAILTAVLAARQWKIREMAGRDLVAVGPDGIHYDLETIHDSAKRLIFYASREAHSAMEKSCKLALVKCRAVATAETNDWAMTGSQLEADIQLDQQRGFIPAYVMVSLGTNASGAVDDLASILPIAKKYGLYVHVNAASLGMFWIEPKYRQSAVGLAEVNSINISLHKAGLHSASSAVLFVRDRKLHLDTFSSSPTAAVGQLDLRDWGIHSSRKFKALKTWFVMSFYGVEGLRRYMKRVVESGEHFKSKVASHPNLKIVGKLPAFGQFCFQYAETEWNKERINKATMDLARQINKSNRLLVSHAVLGGDTHVIRVCTTAERAPRWSVDENYCTLCDLIDEFKTAIGGSQEVIFGLTPLPVMGLVGSSNLPEDRTKGSASEVSTAAFSTLTAIFRK